MCLAIYHTINNKTFLYDFRTHSFGENLGIGDTVINDHRLCGEFQYKYTTYLVCGEKVFEESLHSEAVR